MHSQMYDIYFSGQIMEGKDPLKARQQVGGMFKADQEQLDQLFSGKSIRIKSRVDEETATKYRVAFRNAGALIEIRPSNRGEQQPSASNTADSSTSEASERLTLLPANTGSLEECAPRITPQQLPDISHISLASAGTVLDESQDPEPPEIDTDSLSLGPANTGSLEECKKEVEPYPIPDINHLDLDQS